MKTTKYSLLSLLFLGLLFFAGCGDDDEDGGGDDGEVITTVTLTLTPTDGGSPEIFSFVDLDGDGGIAPVITGGTLQSNTTYNTAITFFNQSEGENENVTLEVIEEDEEHQVFYQFDGIATNFSYGDEDANGNPLGVLATIEALVASAGTLTVILRHEPDKGADGVSGGNITNAGGETDIEVEFPVTIE